VNVDVCMSCGHEAGDSRMQYVLCSLHDHSYLLSCRSRFYDTSIDTATRAVRCSLFVGEGLGVSDVSYGRIR
jgi:hypothetical protein